MEFNEINSQINDLINYLTKSKETNPKEEIKSIEEIEKLYLESLKNEKFKLKYEKQYLEVLRNSNLKLKNKSDLDLLEDLFFKEYLKNDYDLDLICKLDARISSFYPNNLTRMAFNSSMKRN